MEKKTSKSLNLFVSQTIKRLRNEKGISQEELADRCDLDRTYISAVERERRNITIGSLQKIITGLELTERDFLQELIKHMDAFKENIHE
jgi:transcriptional regulator with XRE-family HTH domain